MLAPACLLSFFCTACTMAVHSAVHDQSGRPLQHAVVYATPKEQRVRLFRGNLKTAMVVENFEFNPSVLPVRMGTGVSFLNRDDITHHIYSISTAKNFERFANRLSSSAEVVFDKPGVVVLGCAAHDRTIGHIYVLETPYFATTGVDGKADLDNLPRGTYEVRVWHPGMKADAAARRVVDSAGHRAIVDFTISVQRDSPPERVPSPATATQKRGD